MPRRTPEQAEKFIADILDAVANGGTLVIATQLRAVQIEQKHVEQWRAAGKELIYARGGSIYVRRGKSSDCIDYCNISVFS